MTPLARPLFRGLYWMTVTAGRPFGGIRPRRVYDILGRLGHEQPEFTWERNRWGHELSLSPYYHIDRNILIFGTYDAELHDLLENRVTPGMICMDVGANLGEMALHMGQLVGPEGAVWAFEPVPWPFQRLQDHIRHNGLQQTVHAVPLALSDRTGQTTMAFAADEADNQGLASIVNLSEKAGPRQAAVPTVRLDDFVRDHHLTRLDLIKIDIQGAELLLLDGAAETLARFSPDLVMEISPDDLRHCGKTSLDLCRRIEAAGYAIHRIEHGRPAARLDISEIDPRFSASNVFCTKRAA